ncbi:MAG: alpha/beta hydrolase [Eubacteriales bacterium]|nr:alpha/beta hydrolase [Eubacteriales bacterium]
MNKDYWTEAFSYPSLYWKMAKVKKTVHPTAVSFGPEKNQYFLHFAPSCAESGKVVVWIHGGGWNAGDPGIFSFVGQCFAQAGFHCISLGYRLSPKHKYPCQIEDVCAGFNRAMDYLHDAGVDTGRVIVTGPSAGAHLASILCYDRAVQAKYHVRADKIAGFIGVAGPYAFRTGVTKTVQILLNQLFAKGYDRSLAEPLAVMENTGIPMLLIHSRHDGLIDFSMADRFFRKAQSLGLSAELYEVADRQNTHSGYSAGMFLESRAACQALDKLLSWIEAV